MEKAKYKSASAESSIRYFQQAVILPDLENSLAVYAEAAPGSGMDSRDLPVDIMIQSETGFSAGQQQLKNSAPHQSAITVFANGTVQDPQCSVQLKFSEKT